MYSTKSYGQARFVVVAVFALLGSGVGAVRADSYTSVDATGAWNTGRWNNTTDASPYTATYTANNNVQFTSGTYNFAGMGASINVGDVTLANNVTVNFTSTGNTFATNGAVRTFTLGTGSLFDFNGQGLSTAAGTGFIVTGSGVFATGTYTSTTNAQSFTLSSGTVIARGTTGLGNGAASVLNLNGGTLASNGTLSFANTRFGGGIVIGGNVQFGEVAANVALASNSADLSFANNVSLGAATRTLTLGNAGTVTFSGIISNTASTGLTFTANANGSGRFEVTNTANTFSGDLKFTNGEVRFADAGSFGNVNNNLIIDGGRLSTSSGVSFTIASTHAISVGETVGTSIGTPGAGVLTYNGTIADISGKVGTWAKQGGGTLALGGVSTYTGGTDIKLGTLQLTTGIDRLPTGTTVSLGTAASPNLGTFDLNGQSQQIAGLNSVSGTNATASNNTVTSSGSATLTLGGAGSYSYGGGTNANSGVITGALSVAKTGGGTQTFGDANTYTGTTTLSNGTLRIGSASVGNVGSITSSAIGTGALALNGGTLSSNDTTARTILNPVTFGGNSTIGDSTNAGTLAFSAGGTLTGTRQLTISSPVTFDGSIGESVGNSGLTKTGSSILTLNGSNNYTGTTTISSGTLRGKGSIGPVLVSGSATIGAGTGTATAAATSDFGTLTTGAATFSGDGIFQWRVSNLDGSGNGTPTGFWDTLKVGGITLSGVDSTHQFHIQLVYTNIGTGSTAVDHPFVIPIIVPATSGAIPQFDPATMALFVLDKTTVPPATDAADYSLTQLGDGSIAISYVPEPSSLAVGSISAGCLLLRRRRRSSVAGHA